MKFFILAFFVIFHSAFAADNCEEKYPLEKMAKEIEVDKLVDVTVKVPYEVIYYVTVKVPYEETVACIKTIEKKVKECKLRQLWKCTWVIHPIAIQTTCIVQRFRDVEEKRVRTEYKTEIQKQLQKVKEVVHVLERPAKYAICVTEKKTKAAANSYKKSIQSVARLHESAIRIAVGDEAGAKKTFRKAQEDARVSVNDMVVAAEMAAKLSYDMTQSVPILLASRVFDQTFGTNLVHEYSKNHTHYSREFHGASQRMSFVLQTSMRGENLGKIAFIYAATVVGGPFGAALANVLYDQFILKKKMTEGQMLKSFAIGLAAGYAAEGTQVLAEGKKAIDVARHASYISKVASNMAQQLTTDLGHVALDNESYSTKIFLKSVLSSVVSSELGNDAVKSVLESAINRGLQATTAEIVDNDLNFKKLDFDKIESAIYDGFASGISSEAVRGILDQTVMPYLPKRLDKEAFSAISKLYYETLLESQLTKIEDEYAATLKGLFTLSDKERLAVLDAIKSKDHEIKEALAYEIYKKSYSSLTAQEVLAANFSQKYHEAIAIFGSSLLKNNPQFYYLTALNDAMARNPAEAAKLLEVALRSGEKVSLTLIKGGAEAAGRNASLSAAALRTIGLLGMILHSEPLGEGSEIDPATVNGRRLIPPSSSDKDGWALYNRAIKGDQTAAFIYLNRDYLTKYDIKSEGGIKAIARLVPLLETLPTGHKPVRILEGSDLKKVAVIGRGMVENVDLVASYLRAHGVDVHTFTPSEAAKNEFEDIINSKEVINYKRLQNTTGYRENVEWVKRLKEENFIVIDVGGLREMSPSPYYDIELELLFDIKKQ
jgi:hypothetical protein